MDRVWKLASRVEVIGGALLGGGVVFLVLLILGLPALVIGLGTVAGAIAGGWYGRMLFKQLRRSAGG
jgi:hypothetical protein